MKAHLMYRDRDFEPTPAAWHEALIHDLELTVLFAAMSRDDRVLADVAEKAVLTGSTELDVIAYRQEILKDCLEHEAAVRELYDLTVETIAAERKGLYLGIFTRYPDSILYRAVDLLEMLLGSLRRLRAIADRHEFTFASEGLTTLFTMLRKELTDEYLATIAHCLKQLKFPGGVLVSARLGEGNQGTDYVLREQKTLDGGWMKWLFVRRPSRYSYRLHPRDEAGARALSGLRNRGINHVANVAAQSAEHLLSFFAMLRTELAFYIGCLNLHACLAEQGNASCFPQPFPSGERRQSATGLYDVCLALSLNDKVVVNDLHADDKDLTIITGANQGGKSTFLRGIGISQLMMQCGMFVPAETFHANVCEKLFTHYKREEDPAMKSGKFDEELSRMSSIVDALVPNSLVLFNESFTATNEREGSEIARQIVTALVEKRVKVFFVTHQHTFANELHEQRTPAMHFLQAERCADGVRTLKILEGAPQVTSHGADLYRQIFKASESQ